MDGWFDGAVFLRSQTTGRVRARAGAAAVAAALALASLAAPWSVGAIRAAGTLPTGLSQILAANPTSATVRGIAEFGAVPTSAQRAGLESLGLVVQPMRHVPLALVSGSVASMKAAVAGG